MLKGKEEERAAQQMAQWIINLMYKYEDWVPIFRNPVKLGVVSNVQSHDLQ